MARISRTAKRGYGKQNLLVKEEITVRVASFVFRFTNADEIREYLAFFEKKIHPTSRVPLKEIREIGFRYCSERWFEKLPMYLREEQKRKKVVKALRRALMVVEGGKLKHETH